MLLRTVLLCIVNVTCLFTYASCEQRLNINNERTAGAIPESSADVIMKEDAEEVFYNLDVEKYEGIRCPPATSPENGFIVGEGSQVGTILYMKCQQGYWLSGPTIMACTPKDGTADWDPNIERRCIKGRTFFNEDEPQDNDQELDTLPRQNNENLRNRESLSPPFIDSHSRWMASLPVEDERPNEETDDDRLRQEVNDRLPSLCLAKPEVGPCRATLRRFYYDKEHMECFKFYYGGCEGNLNNFETIGDCMSVCKGGSVLE